MTPAEMAFEGFLRLCGILELTLAQSASQASPAGPSTEFSTPPPEAIPGPSAATPEPPRAEPSPSVTPPTPPTVIAEIPVSWHGSCSSKNKRSETRITSDLDLSLSSLPPSGILSPTTQNVDSTQPTVPDLRYLVSTVGRVDSLEGGAEGGSVESGGGEGGEGSTQVIHRVTHKFSTGPNGSSDVTQEGQVRARIRTLLDDLGELRATTNDLDQLADELVTLGMPLAGSLDRLIATMRYASDAIPDGVGYPARYFRALIIGPRAILRRPLAHQREIDEYLHPPPMPDYMMPPKDPPKIDPVPTSEVRRRTQEAIDRLRNPRQHLLKQA